MTDKSVATYEDGEMKSSEVLRLAAQMVERGKNSLGCSAIEAAAQDDKTIERSAIRWFRKYLSQKKYVWWKDEKRRWWTDKPRNARVIGLCLAAAIAESEGD